MDRDVEQMLRAAMRRSGSSFKTILNAAARAGLTGKKLQAKPRPFVVRAKPMGLRIEIDPAGLNRLADDLEVETSLEKTRRLKQA